MLKLRSIGIDDYSVLEDRQRIGRNRLAEERLPPFWLWAVTIHLAGRALDRLGSGLQLGQSRVQGGVEKLEGPDHARAADSGLRGDERQGL